MATRYLKGKFYQRKLATLRYGAAANVHESRRPRLKTVAAIRCYGVKEILCTPQTSQG